MRRCGDCLEVRSAWLKGRLPGANAGCLELAFVDLRAARYIESVELGTSKDSVG